MIKINVNHFTPEELLKLTTALTVEELEVVNADIGTEAKPHIVSLFTFIDNLSKSKLNEIGFKNSIISYLNALYKSENNILEILLDAYGEKQINFKGKLSKYTSAYRVICDGDQYDKKCLLHEFIRNFK